MTLKETLTKLKSLGNEKMRIQNKKNGADDNQFGVKLGDIRTLAKTIKTNHELAKSLWETGNIDARLLSTLLIDPNALSISEIDEMVRSVKFLQVADWLNAYVVKQHPDNEKLREKWMHSSDPMAARACWSLTSGRVVRSPDGLDLPAILDRIESEMPNAAPEVQWTMNSTLAQIGICYPVHRKRAIAIGEKLGSIATIPFLRVVLRLSLRFGLRKW
jgi:3-methyladenine DNA glycosylase AlkD